MKHFLENTYQEIENTRSRIDALENKKIFLFFTSSFKKQYIKYAALKKIFLLNYSSLYSDIRQDSKSKNIILSEIDNVKNSIIYITDTIESCMKVFMTFNNNSLEEKNIIQIEKDFLIVSITSFRKDLKVWIKNHSQEISDEISKIQDIQSNTAQINHKSVLELQVKRLELQIQNLSNIIK